MAKVIVITGANRGLGLEFCRQYLAGGNKIYACCRSPEKAFDLLGLKQSAGDRLEIVPLDVSNSVMLNNLPHIISEPVDILINNAGVYGPRDKSVGQIDPHEWNEVLKVNTIAPLMLIQVLLDKVITSNEKKIILMSSRIASIEDNQKGGSYIYRSSKTALNAIGKSLAVDLKDQGVSVGIVHPGWVLTDMGGANALIDVQTSINGLCKVIENLNLTNSGQFFNYDGSGIPW